MDKVSTGQKDQFNNLIYVGDLVSLGIPRKKGVLVVFVVKENLGTFELLAYKDSIDPTHPRYRQNLNQQVYKVIGNIETGIDENLLV